MDELDQKMLLRLTFEPETMPRNRNFETHAAPEFQAVRAHAAHLRSLFSMLEEAAPGDVRVRYDAARAAVEFYLPEIRGGSRQTWIDAAVFAVVAERDALGAILARHGVEADELRRQALERPLG